jgi:DNA-binding FadR family transcriptional regulator
MEHSPKAPVADGKSRVGARSETASASLVWKIVEYLREKRLEPGDRLPGERYLAERFGVGRNTLREAFAALVALRVLETRPHSGVYLRKSAVESSFEALVLLAELGAPPSKREVLESIEIRMALEQLAVRLACERRGPEDLRRLTDTVEATDRVLATSGNICALDQSFHTALAEASHNSVLVRILHAFYRLSLARRQTYFEDVEKGRQAAEDHRALVQAITARDAAQAEILMSGHLGMARRYWEEHLTEPAAEAAPRAGEMAG